MPIDTRLDGRPEQVHATARWLRTRLAFEVGAGASAMNSARSSAAGGWQGAAGTAFQTRMATTATTAGDLRDGIERTAGNLTAYADQLAVAQQHMANAREIAANGGLAVDGFVIREPGAAPAAPDPAAAPASLTAYTDAVAAHQRQVDAYLLADGEARKADAAMKSDPLDNMVEDVQQKWPLMIADGINGAYGGFLTLHMGILRQHGDEAAKLAKQLEGHYLKAQGGSAHSKSLIKLISEAELDSHAAKAQATSVGKRFAGKVPVIGAVITVAGIGYDIQHGKPAAKAILSGGGGMLASIAGGAATGAAIGALGANPVTVVIGGAIGGVVAGVATSGLIDAGYDRLPEGVKDAFDDGQAAISRAADEVGDDARELWHKIF
jgi:uncharacterized protein YukE